MRIVSSNLGDSVLTLARLAALTALPVRRLQYVCDHGIVPGTAGKGHGFGVARTFTDYEAFGVALAAHLLHAGHARKLVAAALRVSCTPKSKKGRADDTPLYRAWRADSASLEIGDGCFVRLRGRIRPGVPGDLDTGWMPLHSRGTRLRWLTPVVGTRVDLDQIARAIRASDHDPML